MYMNPGYTLTRDISLFVYYCCVLLVRPHYFIQRLESLEISRDRRLAVLMFGVSREQHVAAGDAMLLPWI